MLPAPSSYGSDAPSGVASLPTSLDADVATAAGNDEGLPRAFLVACDIAVLLAAFAATHVVAPWVQWLLLPSGPLPVVLPEWLQLPSEPTFEAFPALTEVLWMPLVIVPLTILFLEVLGGYRQIVDQSRTRVAVSCLFSPVLALGFVALALLALKTTSESRVLIFTFGLLSGGALLAYRLSVRLYKVRRLAVGAYAKNVLLIGEPAVVTWLAQHFGQNVPANRYRLVGWLDADPTGLAGASAPEAQLPYLGLTPQLGDLLITRPIHEVIAVQSSGQSAWLRRVIEDCDYFRVRLRIVPEALLVGTPRDLKLVFRTALLRLPEVVLDPPHLDSDRLFIKRLVDVVVSAALLILLSPLLLLIALAIKISTPRLPVFYPWRVIGLKGSAFTGYKFTTMEADADHRREILQALNEMEGPVFKIARDPRVTSLGRVLRKYSLNELPQLWSVLKGDMSLVGPRPAFRHELERYELWHKRKLCVKPGMTCLWQVSGRNRINQFDDWVRLDLEYIDQWSLWLDFRILARTVIAVVAGTGS